MIARYTWSLPAFLLLCSPSTIRAQANDNCANATAITVGTPGSCPGSAIVGNNGSATDSNVPPTCDPSTNGYRDVWYTFNTGNNTQISITLTPLTATDWNYAIHDACSGTELVCVTVPTGSQNYTVTPNADFILQVESNLDFGAGGTFELCIEGNSGGTAPANDECATATTLAMGTSCTYTPTTALNATVSPQAIWCVPSPNEDVWFSFVSTSTEVNIEVAPTNLMDPVLSLYSGNCTNPTIIGCVNDFGYGEAEYLVNIPVVVGQSYRVRVHDNWSQAVDLGFGICVWGVPPPPPPPANDDCAGAILVPMQVPCVPQTYDGYGATQGSSPSTCNGGAGSEDDVWFKFVATGPEVRITVDGSGTGSTGYDPVVNLVFSGTCSSFNLIACADDTGPGATEVLEVPAVNPGATYYVQVYDADADVPASTTFTLCVQDISTGVGMAEPLDLLLVQDEASRRVGLSLDGDGAGGWAVLDAQGRTVTSGGLVARPGAVHWIPLPDRSAGVYLVRAYVGGRVGVRRFTLP